MKEPGFQGLAAETLREELAKIRPFRPPICARQKPFKAVAARLISAQGFWPESQGAHFPATPLQYGLMTAHGHQVWITDDGRRRNGRRIKRGRKP
jgi:hypothetical protein